MKKLKNQIARLISGIASEKFGAELTVGQVTELMEYPPEASMGDIAIPCFKLAKPV